MKDLWWTEWHWDKFFSELFGFFCQYHYHFTGGSMLLHHVGDEQHARWWPQFRDVVSPHNMSNNNNKVQENQE
jgi:hypothetical protein